MGTIKGIVLGLGFYIIIATIAKSTGFNKLVMFIWTVSAVIAYGNVKNAENRSEKKKALMLMGFVALLGTMVVYFLEMVGIYLERWL